MIVLAATGLASILLASEKLFLAIKLAGAGYLLYLAYQLWCAKTELVGSEKRHHHSKFTLAKQEFMLAAGNPKAIIIFSAFLPQFIDTQQPIASQFIQLGG